MKKIKVLRHSFNEDLAKEYVVAGLRRCEILITRL